MKTFFTAQRKVWKNGGVVLSYFAFLLKRGVKYDCPALSLPVKARDFNQCRGQLFLAA